ncbi:hypothetical protein ACROYT_G027860 [Oculina patagonica]
MQVAVKQFVLVILVVCCGDGDGDGSRTSGTGMLEVDCGGGAKSCGSSCWWCQLKIMVCKLQTAVELVAFVVQVVDCGGDGARSSKAGVKLVVLVIIDCGRCGSGSGDNGLTDSGTGDGAGGVDNYRAMLVANLAASVGGAGKGSVDRGGCTDDGGGIGGTSGSSW